MLQLINVSKAYKKNKAVNNVSFTIQKGDIFGLIGTNGAGKSTTLSMIATLKQPDSGEILYEGVDVIRKPEVIRSQLGIVPQQIALYPTLSGYDNFRFFGNVYGLKQDALEQQIKKLCTILRIREETLKDKVAHYSGGMQRKMNIGVSLLHNPKLVIMDEPTVGLDIASRQQILECIKGLKELGTTIIYTGHYMEEVEEICNRIGIMDEGVLKVIGSKEELLRSAKGNMPLSELFLQIVYKK